MKQPLRFPLAAALWLLLLTALALLRLVEAKRLDLDAPIQRYLPDFPEKDGLVTTRLLAGHLAGMGHAVQACLPRHGKGIGKPLRGVTRFGAPQKAMTASPMYLSMVPLESCTIRVIGVRYSSISLAVFSKLRVAIRV